MRMRTRTQVIQRCDITFAMLADPEVALAVGGPGCWKNENCDWLLLKGVTDGPDGPKV